MCSYVMIAITAADFGENGDIGVTTVINVAAWTNGRFIVFVVVLTTELK